MDLTLILLNVFDRHSSHNALLGVVIHNMLLNFLIERLIKVSLIDNV